MPGRPRKPTALLKFTGALARNPARYKDRENNPEPDMPIGPAPDSLNDKEQEVYNRIVELMPEGVLCDCDEFVVELAARLIVASRERTIKTSELSILVNVLGRIGFTPQDRSKINVKPTKQEEDDPFNAF